MKTSSEFSTALLPTSPRPGMAERYLQEDSTSIGDNLIIYKRVAYVQEPPIGRLMSPEDWKWHEKHTRRCWAAECSCTACGDTWYAGWRKSGGVVLGMGEDGTLYDNVIDPEVSDAVSYEEGSVIPCPRCDNEGMLVRKTRINGSWTNQLMVCSVENAGEYTALVFWLIKKVTWPDGDYDVATDPVYAAVLDRKGDMQYYKRSHIDMQGRVWPQDCGWEGCGTVDPDQNRYYDRDAISHNAVGAWYYERVPDQEGKTGEKTGLEDYIRDGGEYPLLYLRWWRAYPEVENLVKAGWTQAISGAIRAEVSAHLANGLGRIRMPALGELCNWGARRPCDLLRMGKAEEREARTYHWDYRTLSLWSEMVDYNVAGPGMGHAALLQRCINRYGFEDVHDWANAVIEGEEWCLEEMDRYLCRQEKRWELSPSAALRTLMDYQRMLPEDAGPEELWPNNLRAAHDALAETVKAKASAEMDAAFRRIGEKWSRLNWTDGEICIRLARSLEELVQEGRTLHHCVGTYGPAHAKGRVILFVRHHRRPERSWYTLNIDLTGREPREIQLHGFKNEHAHGIRLHIPRRVREAVDRWEREVLEPVFRQVRKKKEEAA